MRPIEDIEKTLSDKRKTLLHRLREHNWKVVGFDDSDADWTLDQTWLIESTREGAGTALTLWLFKYDGIHDGMDRVVATPNGIQRPAPYTGEPALEFDTRRFEAQLADFIHAIHELRIHG